MAGRAKARQSFAFETTLSEELKVVQKAYDFCLYLVAIVNRYRPGRYRTTARSG